MNHTSPPKDPGRRSLYEMWWEREPARATRWETEKICRKATPGPRRRLRNTSQAWPSTLSAVVGVPNSTFAPVLGARLPDSRKISRFPRYRGFFYPTSCLNRSRLRARRFFRMPSSGMSAGQP